MAEANHGIRFDDIALRSETAAAASDRLFFRIRHVKQLDSSTYFSEYAQNKHLCSFLIA